MQYRSDTHPVSDPVAYPVSDNHIAQVYATPICATQGCPDALLQDGIEVHTTEDEESEEERDS